MNETRMLATTTTSRSIDLPSQSGFANIPCKPFENYETFHQQMYHQIELVRKLQVNSDMSNKEKVTKYLIELIQNVTHKIHLNNQRTRK